jgi:hypothetical protein
VNGVGVPGAAAGSYYNNRCSTTTGHGIPAPDAVTVPALPGGAGLAFEVRTGSVKEIIASVFAGETPTSEPITLRFPKDTARATVPNILPGTYYVMIRVEWEGLFDAGAETYAFRIILRGA